MPSLGQVIAGRNNNYNSIRFVLAASVIYFHSFGMTKAVGYADPVGAFMAAIGTTTGGLAVDCFFFLSGLFVTQSFYRDHSPINFAVRRFCRLWPGLFVCLIVTATIGCILAKGVDAWLYLLEPSFYHYITHNSVLSLVWFIPGVFDGRPYSAINGSIHTLPTEVKMYFIVLCAGTLMLLRRRRTILLTALVVLTATLLDYGFFVTHLAMPPDYGQAPMAMFFAGVALFAVADHVRMKWWCPVGCLGLAFVAPAALTTFFAYAAASSGMIVVGQMRYGWRPKADVSYGIYIYGWPCQQFILTFFPSLNPYLLSGSALLLSWGFAALSWRIVEQPAIAFGHGLAATWTEFRRKGEPSPAIRRLLSIAALPRLATLSVVFMLCVGMSWAAEQISLTPVSPLAVKITAFGPNGTRARQGFNIQPSGASAIWVAFDKRPPERTSIVFDGETLDTTVGPDVATAAVPDALFSVPGDKTLLLELRGPGYRERSAPVIFRVTK